MKIKLLTILWFGFYSLSLVCQTGFHFNRPRLSKQNISFKLINNLIVIPIEVNGEELSFILDTGVNRTILFNPSKGDSTHYASSSNSMLRGLGEGKSIHAIISKNNVCKIKNIINLNETFHVTVSNVFDFSKKMGITIHGIIGHSLFKNFVVKINYQSKKITFYRSDSYSYKRCKKCSTQPIIINNNKPYINTQISLDTIGDKLIDVKLLIDSGGSDAMWLFENSKKEIKTPKLFFKDVLGEGISGHVYGNRSRIRKIKLADFEIENPTVSFLDSTSTHIARKYKTRNGSIGGSVLKRFTVWFDYPNKKITFKKNMFFTDEFNYNMSGLDIVYNGMTLVKQNDFNTDQNSDKRNASSPVYFKYKYLFKPSYVVNHVVVGSPAYIEGLKKGDVLLKINHKSAHEYELEDVFYKLEEENGKKIKLKVNRDGEIKKFEFKLKKKI